MPTMRENIRPLDFEEVKRRSRTTRHETPGNVTLFSFSVAVPDEDLLLRGDSEHLSQ